MKKYWTCSDFANIIRGTPKGGPKSGKEWREWEESAKAAHPFRYWLAEDGLHYLETVISWPVDQLQKVKHYFSNRWITKTHALTSSSLKVGQWHELDSRLLHCMFDELVNFVEIDEANSNVAWDLEARKKYDPYNRRQSMFRIRPWRCPEAGIDKLKWASTLTNEEWLDEDNKHLAEPAVQALAAREILELYTWWKTVRPARVDPFDASGWTEICEARRTAGKHWLDFEDRSEEEQQASRASLDKLRALEEQYLTEDEEMMIRLIRVRRSLWT